LGVGRERGKSFLNRLVIALATTPEICWAMMARHNAIKQSPPGLSVHGPARSITAASFASTRER